MDEPTINDLIRELGIWVRTLANKASDDLGKVKSALISSEPLPQNCPSRASLALMELRDFEKALKEVNGLAEQVRKAIIEHS